MPKRVRKPRLTDWPEHEKLDEERRRRLVEREERARKREYQPHRKRSVNAFIRSGFTVSEAEGLVYDEYLKPSTGLGKLFARRRYEEVRYYMRELNMTKEEAAERASELREELMVYADSPSGAFADSLKWSTKYTTQTIVWEEDESIETAGIRFEDSRTPFIKKRRPVEEYF